MENKSDEDRRRGWSARGVKTGSWGRGDASFVTVRSVCFSSVTARTRSGPPAPLPLLPIPPTSLEPPRPLPSCPHCQTTHRHQALQPLPTPALSPRPRGPGCNSRPSAAPPPTTTTTITPPPLPPHSTVQTRAIMSACVDVPAEPRLMHGPVTVATYSQRAGLQSPNGTFEWWMRNSFSCNLYWLHFLYWLVRKKGLI